MTRVPDGRSNTAAFAARLRSRLQAPDRAGQPGHDGGDGDRDAHDPPGSLRLRVAARVAVWRAEGGRRSIPRRALRAARRRGGRLARRALLDARGRAGHHAARARRRARALLRPAGGATAPEAARADVERLLRAGGSHSPATGPDDATIAATIAHWRAGPVVDTACGDGPLLRAMRDAGIDAVGLDLDGAGVERSIAAGATAYELRWQEYLPRLDSGVLGGVFVSQRFVWLDRENVRALLQAFEQALRSDGSLVIELVGGRAVPEAVTGWTAEHPEVGIDEILAAARAMGLEGSTSGGPGEARLIVVQRGGRR